ncbi:MAG: hypothetical protein HY751_05015 [Nitrospinae bacterium]|nr:hypothetical protein [Nitrospinota bacterium]
MASASEVPTSRIEQDLILVRRVSEGDGEALRSFVETHTRWALYKTREWCVEHCPHRAGGVFCGLTGLSLRLNGKIPQNRLEECDEGMDTYLWIFDQLKRKLKTYTGRNGCLLSTYVWTILNSREFYIDWLRWKYGRAF